ncbi:hypothetical protein ABPG75_000941 [Micractinium tetrahymenae]
MDAIACIRSPVVAGIDVSLQRHTAFSQARLPSPAAQSPSAARCPCSDASQHPVQNCESVIQSLGDAAVDLARGGGADPQQVEELRGAVVQLLEARRQGQLQAAALQELKGGYEAGQGVTDFQAALSGRAAALAAAQPYDPQADPLYRDFELAARGEAAEAADEQIDDDIAIEGGAAQLAPNARCPISNKQAGAKCRCSVKPVLDIEEPMQDATGVVYEKAAVVGYFRTLHPSKRGRDIIVAGELLLLLRTAGGCLLGAAMSSAGAGQWSAAAACLPWGGDVLNSRLACVAGSWLGHLTALPSPKPCCP